MFTEDMNKNIPVIYYHSVAPSHNKNWLRSWLTLELKYFEEQLNFFRSNNFRSLLLEEYFYRRTSDKKQGNLFVLTFDDGYLDNYIYVFPLLKKYNVKATIFINPVFVDESTVPRHNLQSYWDGKCLLSEIDQWGFLNWEEMHEMEQSGLIDIQSHTLTHTKYFISDILTGFHHPGADCLYPVGNRFPEQMPYYIGNPEFECLLPYGFPLFEEHSSVVARKVVINEDFNQEITEMFNKYDWETPYSFETLFRIAEPVYLQYRKNGKLIVEMENDSDYKKRIILELSRSKEIIEKKLNKEVAYCCWPHGDNNNFVHRTAIELGYKATTMGNTVKYNSDDFPDDRIPPRISLSGVQDSLFLTRLKTRYKIGSYEHRFPYYQINKFYYKARYGISID